MARTAMKVDISLLVHVFKEQDGKGLKNQNVLWSEVATAYKGRVAGDHKPISAGVVRLRMLDAKYEIKTPKGKRGRSDVHLSRKGGKGKKSDKFKNDPVIVEAFKELRKATPERFLPLVVLAEKGSRSAALKLNCLECSGWSTQDVRTCVIPNCALYAFRPYQGKGKVEVVEELAEAA